MSSSLLCLISWPLVRSLAPPLPSPFSNARVSPSFSLKASSVSGIDVYFFARALLGVFCFVGLQVLVGDGTSSTNGELGSCSGLWGKTFSASSCIEKLFLSTVMGVLRFAFVVDSGESICDILQLGGPARNLYCA